MNKLKSQYIVHTPNKGGQLNYRFQEDYWGEYENYDRLTLVGIPLESDKILSIGVAFCTYPDNFSRHQGYIKALVRAEARYGFKSFATIKLDDFTQENCLAELYAIHDSLIKLPIKEVKKIVSKQVVK
jgi:hypothetical protein